MNRLPYRPFPKQVAFHQSQQRYRLQVGGAGSGKSMALLWEAIVNYCLRYPGAQCLLIRKNFPELEKGLISDLHATVPSHIFKWNDAKHIATFGSGSQLYFGHCENGSERALSQYLSSAFVFIGIDELGQFSFEAWDFLKSRNRVNASCQANESGDMPHPTMAGATNPIGVGWGWIKALWIDHRVPPQLAGADISFDDYWYIHSTILDNPAQQERDPDYINKLRQMPLGMRAKLLEGDVNIVSGQYYTNFSPDRHIVNPNNDPKRIEWQPWQPCWIGLDWGLAHYTAVLWFTKANVRNLDGTRTMRTVCYREMAVKETAIKDVARLIRESTRGTPAYSTPDEERKALKRIYISHELFARRTSPNRDQTVAAELERALRRQGMPTVARASGSASQDERVAAAVMIYEQLEVGNLLFLSSCEQLLRAVPMLVRSERNLEDVQKATTLEDDLFDALKHGILSAHRDQRKPWEIEVQEQAREIADPLARWFFLCKNKNREQSPTVHQQVEMRWEREARRGQQ